MLWSYPDADRAPIAIDTRHEMNIFGVEFMPCTGSSMVISSAYDRMVQLHRLDRTSVPTAGPYRPSSGGSAPIATQSVQCHTQVFTNHSESVKVRYLVLLNLACMCIASRHATLFITGVTMPDGIQATSAPRQHLTDFHLQSSLLEQIQCRSVMSHPRGCLNYPPTQFSMSYP